MARIYFVLLAVLFFPYGAQAYERRGGTETDYAAIEALEDVWIDRYRARDINGLVDLYTTDAWIMARKRKLVRGHDEIKTLFQAIMGNTKVDMVTNNEELVVKGDWAWSIATFMITYESVDPDGKSLGAPVQDFGRALLVYQKGADGKWRISRDIDTPTPDAEVLKPK